MPTSHHSDISPTKADDWLNLTTNRNTQLSVDPIPITNHKNPDRAGTRTTPAAPNRRA